MTDAEKQTVLDILEREYQEASHALEAQFDKVKPSLQAFTAKATQLLTLEADVNRLCDAMDKLHFSRLQIPSDHPDQAIIEKGQCMRVFLSRLGNLIHEIETLRQLAS